MPFSATRLIKYQAGMRRRIESLRSKTADSLDFAVDHMMQERVDSFFRVEEGLEEITFDRYHRALFHKSGAVFSVTVVELVPEAAESVWNDDSLDAENGVT